MSEQLSLTQGNVHLWYAYTDGVESQQWLTRFDGLLSREERARHEKFVFQKDRDQFLIARILLRTTLSRYSKQRPGEWRFHLNEFGKPELDSSQSSSPLQFNLSHCDGLVLCGVTVGCPIGVDCENINRNVEFAKLAPRVFSVREQKFLDTVPSSLLPEMFFRFWTLKEAYVKARGLGMSLPLQQFSIDFSDIQRIRIFFSTGIQDRSEEWQFLQPAISKPYIAALALNLPQKLSLNVELHEAFI